MEKVKIAVIGLGYVGLPLAQRFAELYPVVGYDIDDKRIAELRQGSDTTLVVSGGLIEAVIRPTSSMSPGLYLTDTIEEIADCNFHIIAVPTPVDARNKPDLSQLLKASTAVGNMLKKGDVVVYESTVYPGATEEECVPILERKSGLRLNRDFFVGYSPERINPGDKEHTIDKVIKVTSGSTPKAAKEINSLYASIIPAGTHMAPSIKVAEAAKVIENAQRDINIAFVNELAKIFNLMDIDIYSVLEASATKWNFLPFKPGLVGGHCIGVDPYYLAYKAEKHNYNPEIILAGRRINDSMGPYIASELMRLMSETNIRVKSVQILILGITFKENCPDVRNTKIVDMILELKQAGAEVTVYDPWASSMEVRDQYDIELTTTLPARKFDVIVLAVAHDVFLEAKLRNMLSKRGFVYDVKGVLGNEADYQL